MNSIETFFCNWCGLDIPVNFQQECIFDEKDKSRYHLHVGIRRIKRNSPEWKERVIPILKQALEDLEEGKK